MYQNLNEFIGKRQQKKYANNTWLRRSPDNDMIAMQYHDTNVAILRSDGTITLNSGGWLTSTTKERMNWALAGSGWNLVQDNRIWYLVLGIWPKRGTWHRFQDGVTVCGESISGQGVSNPEQDKKNFKHAKTFAELCAESLPLDSTTKEGSIVAEAILRFHNAPLVLEGAFNDSPLLWADNFVQRAVEKSVYRYMLAEMGYAV